MIAKRMAIGRASRSPHKYLFSNRLHECAIRLWQRSRPGRFVARFGQQVSEFDHLARRQFPDIYPDGAAAFDFCHVSHRLRHQSDHSRFVDGSAPASDMPIDEDLIMLQRRASHEVIAGLHLLENDLGEKAWRAGDLAMDAGDLAGNPALLFGREPALRGRADVGWHRLLPRVQRRKGLQATFKALASTPSSPTSRSRMRRSASALMR